MKASRLSLAVLVGAAFVTSITFGRVTQAWSYEELMAKSDLVVIALPLNTKDTGERIDLPGIRVVTSEPEGQGMPAIGIETEFEILVTIKGPNQPTRITLHHYRLEPQEPSEAEIEFGIRIVTGGPALVSFDPSGRNAYLMFLVREKDGRYAPTSGQTDPARYSIHPLQGSEPQKPGQPDGTANDG